MKQSLSQVFIVRHLLKWTLLTLPVALTVGSMVALFLWSLDKAIDFRFAHTWLLWLLPLSGILIYVLYKFFGKNSDAGNNLIMDEIHQPGGGVPARMAPLVLVTTVITHLFGGSAGREGTAVQIGGSLSQFIGKLLKLSGKDIQMLLMTGIAAGFGAVFGTPITGAIFALEVLALGTMRYEALLPCLMAAIGADVVCAAWGIHHTHYAIHFVPDHFDFRLLGLVIAGGVAFGWTSLVFSELSHTIKNYSKRYIKIGWLIPVVGGALIIGLTYALGTQDYLSLGVKGLTPSSVTIPSCFTLGSSYLELVVEVALHGHYPGHGIQGRRSDAPVLYGRCLRQYPGHMDGRPCGPDGRIGIHCRICRSHQYANSLYADGGGALWIG